PLLFEQAYAMHTLTWLDTDTPLPSPRQAPRHGLLAARVDLSTERLAEAYGKGLFPVYDPGDPLLWWSPVPRTLLGCSDLRISRSLAKRLRKLLRSEQEPGSNHKVTVNTAFRQVMQACAQPALGREQTWITADIMRVYQDWHRAGHVHSIELWQADSL